MITSLKGLNTWWLRESAKLNYDSLGMALDGQTIEIKFIARGSVEFASAITYGRRMDSLPSDFITLAININNNGRMDSNNPNGLVVNEKGETIIFLDRVVAHEMVHAVMMATGTFKGNMAQFFTEGVADLVQGDDDDNSGMREDMIKLVTDSDTLTQALNFLEGTGSKYAYPAGDMLMRFLAKQNLNTTTIIGDSTQAQTFDFNGNDTVITNYVESDTINYNATFNGASISDTSDDFIAETSEGAKLIVRDVRGKWITLNSATGTAYAYMTKEASEMDGRALNGGNNYEIFFGSNYANDVIRAGNGGAYLWGGHRGNDELYGGNGSDNFVYKMDGGNDTVYNAESQDVINLRDVELSAISTAQINDNGVYLGFTDGGSININGQASMFVVESNDTTKVYSPDYQNKTWNEAQF